MMRAPALYRPDSGCGTALSQPIGPQNSSNCVSTVGQRMALKMSHQQGIKPGAIQQQQQHWPPVGGTRYGIMHGSPESPINSADCIECQKQESDCSCSNSLDCSLSQHPSPLHQPPPSQPMGQHQMLGHRQQTLHSDSDCAFINQHHHQQQTTTYQQHHQHRPLMSHSSVPPFNGPLGAPQPLAAHHHHTHPHRHPHSHAAHQPPMPPLVRQTTYTFTSDTITDQSILGHQPQQQTNKHLQQQQQRQIALEPQAQATHEPNQHRTGQSVEFIPATLERVNEQVGASNYQATAAAVGVQAETLEQQQQQQQYNSNKQRQTVSFRRSITADQSEFGNKQLNSKQQSIYNESGFQVTVGDKTTTNDPRQQHNNNNNKGGQLHRQRSAGSGLQATANNTTATLVPKSLDSSRISKQINNNQQQTASEVGAPTTREAGGKQNNSSRTNNINNINNNNAAVVPTSGALSGPQTSGPYRAGALACPASNSPVLASAIDGGGAASQQHLHQQANLAQLPGATYPHPSPLHGAHRSNHLLAGNGSSGAAAAAAAAAFDGISLPPITSHRTNSPWMRISSIILTPIGIVIILFIVVSPLLHYLM